MRYKNDAWYLLADSTLEVERENNPREKLDKFCKEAFSHPVKVVVRIGFLVFKRYVALLSEKTGTCTVRNRYKDYDMGRF